MNSKRVFYLMVGCLVVLVAGTVAATYFASGMLASRAKVLSDLKVQNSVLTTEQVSLTQAKKDVAKYTPLETISKSVVPQDKDQAETIREIVKIANDSGIQPSSITFPASTLGALSPGAAATGATGGPAITPPKSGGSANLTQLTPVKGTPGLYVLPITIVQDSSAPVSYAKFIGFLNRLEQNRRTAQVTSIVLQPLPQDRSQLSFTLTLQKYIKP
jgi:hypothetical protein